MPPRNIRAAPRGGAATARRAQASAATKVKTYACVVWCGRDMTTADAAVIGGAAPMTVHQKTPVRVMHSRSLATRDKEVLSLRLELLGPRFGILRIVTAAGMYDRRRPKSLSARRRLFGLILAALDFGRRPRSQAGKASTNARRLHRYIKEFVHGDLGRTEPSLSSLLGAEADILQLDVMDVHDDLGS